MTFRNAFNFESDESANSTVGYDGMVLEISINGGPFQDLLTAGGSFVTGGYNKVISPSYDSPLASRLAWSGLSAGTDMTPGYITTTINMPVAAYGQLVRMRWIVATDSKSIASGDSGANVDTVVGVACTTTAAGVDISGRVATADGLGLRNATVSITDQNGVVSTVRTSSFGFFRFEDVAPGNTYIVAVKSRRYRFASRVVQVFDSIADIDFVGIE